ncbi:aspartate kinase, partial [Pseudoxanthomonas kaohsiungensis]
MALIVQKYGGTSMGSVERIEHVASKVKSFHDQGHQVVVVVSAMSGETDRLLKLAKSINPRGSARELDQIISTGEQVTIGLLALALQKAGLKSRSYTGPQVAIRTDEAYGKARIQSIDGEKLLADCREGVVPVVAGFQGLSPDGSTATLGRGGSDTTGVAIAAAMKADECQIYTDVDGVYTTDPRVEP